MTKFNRNSIVAIAVASFVFGITGPFVALAATNPNLGSATPFSILSQTGITGTTLTPLLGISGDVENNGLSTAITALTTAMVGGTIYADGGLTVSGSPTSASNPAVQADASAAYTASQPGGVAEEDGGSPIIVTELGGLTRGPGVYTIPGNATLSGVLTLNGPGTYIFRTGPGFNITSAIGGSISFTNGARACDLFWSIGTSAEIGSPTFAGTILSSTGVHFLAAGTTLDGRALAVGADVSLNTTDISGPSCAVPATPVPNTAGQTAPNPAPLISVIKVPTPFALPFGPGSVTYDYTVLNIGVVPMSNITVTDNKCSAVNFILGDANVNSKLDVDETWKYSCTTTLAQTTTNIVTATGQHDFLIASDTAEATVVVGVPVVPPLIHVVKKPSVFVLPANGGPVTYTYTVTNPGTVALSDVSISDDKCTGLPDRVTGHPGDLNKNNLLESDEVWSFTCQSNLAQTTTNIGTAKGSANGLTATDFSIATVVVSAPIPQVLGVAAGFPNTGFPPQDNSNAPWNVIIPTGILIALYSAYSIRKKQVI